MPDVAVTTDKSARRTLASAPEIEAAVVNLLERARRAVVVYAPVLAPAPFNGTAFTRALAGFAARHRVNTLRLLVDNGQQALRDNDRLVNLSRRLGDTVKWREATADDCGGVDVFIVADGALALHLPDRLRNEADWAETPDLLPRDLQTRFEQLWERGQPATALNPVGL